MGLDSCIFIYLLEEHPKYLHAVAPIFEAIAAGKLEACTSELTLLETLVRPLRAGNVLLARRYEKILAGSIGLRVVPLDRIAMRAAAHLRASMRIATPDALHVAAVLSAGCSVFVTNDRILPDIPGLTVLQLADQMESAGSVHDPGRRRYGSKGQKDPSRQPRRRRSSVRG